MRARRRVAALLLSLVIVGLPATAVAADDVTAPVGTLTIGNGSGWSKTRTVTVQVAATDDVAVTTMRLTWGETVVDLPYAPTASFTVPYDEYWGVSITWFDAAGNSSTTGGCVIVDTKPPEINTFRPAEEDPDPSDGLFPFAVIGSDEWGSPTHVRVRTAGNPTWSPVYPLPAPNAWSPLILEWAALDPSKGGSPTLGPRTVVVWFGNLAGNWSNETRQVHIGFYNVPIVASGDQRTGHAVTFRPDIPSGVTYKAGTICRWTLFWGNDQSLYYGERDDTFGSVEFQGPLSGGYCQPWTVTIPWVPVRQFLVVFRAETGGEAVVAAEVGANGPDDPAFEPGEHSMSRHITTSSLPIVYVLPETYNLIVGDPATYRAYTIAGAKLRATDVWSVNYIDTPERLTGARSTFTFTPKIVGHITVCWNGGASQTYWIHACYDPPSRRRRDITPPNTGTPVVETARTAVSSGHGVQIRWGGTIRGWGIASYRLERSVDGGAWARVNVESSATSTVQSLAVAHTYRYRVRATDKAGNVGAWDYSVVYDLRRQELHR